MDITTIIGNNITKFRTENGFSTEYIYKKMNIGKTTYHKYVTYGVDSLTFVFRFAEVFNYDLINGRYLSPNETTINIFGEKKDFYKKALKELKNDKKFIIFDQNRCLLDKVGFDLEQRGYEIKILNLIDPNASDYYNPFARIVSDNEIKEVVDAFFKHINTPTQNIILFESLLLYLKAYRPQHQQHLESIMKLLRAKGKVDDNDVSILDKIFKEVEERYPNSSSVKKYNVSQQFNTNDLLLLCEKQTTRELLQLTMEDSIDMEQINLNNKIAYFVLYDDIKTYWWLIYAFSKQMIKTITDVTDIQLLCNKAEIQQLFNNVSTTKNTYKIRKNISLEKARKCLDLELKEKNIKKLTYTQLENEIENVKNLPKLEKKLLKLCTENENVSKNSPINILANEIYFEISRIKDNMIEEQVKIHLKEKENGNH